MDEADLQTVILAYRNNKVQDTHLIAVFSKLGELHKYDYQDRASVLNEAARLCLEKQTRYDPQKGKARNFFLTIIGCYLSQARALHRRLNYHKLRKQHD